MPSARKTAAVVALCVACIAPFEGLRRVAYTDPVGIPTACFGETQGIKIGDEFSVEECHRMLEGRLTRDFIPGVERCIERPLPARRKAAFVSLAYNIGVTAFCRSTVVRKYNAGDTVGACDAMLAFVYAKGIKLPGLVTRREKERDLCLQS